MHWYRFQQSWFKITSAVLTCPDIQGLVEDRMHVSQVKVPISGVDAEYQWICACLIHLTHGIINQ